MRWRRYEDSRTRPSRSPQCPGPGRRRVVRYSRRLRYRAEHGSCSPQQNSVATGLAASLTTAQAWRPPAATSSATPGRGTGTGVALIVSGHRGPEHATQSAGAPAKDLAGRRSPAREGVFREPSHRDLRELRGPWNELGQGGDGRGIPLSPHCFDVTVGHERVAAERTHRHRRDVVEEVRAHDDGVHASERQGDARDDSGPDLRRRRIGDRTTRR